MRRAVTALVAALACSTPPHAAMAQQEPVIRASCNQEGRIVYREDFPAGSPAEKRILIAARYPEAMCVFLSVSAEDDPLAVEGQEIVAAAAGNPGDAGLAAALSIIAGGAPGSPYPMAFAEEMSKLAAPADSSADREARRLLNFTIGIYRGVPLSDVMAHWKAMQEGTEVLSRMTPTVNGIDGVTVVSIEGVPDELAVTLCEEAEKEGPGCVAVY